LALSYTVNVGTVTHLPYLWPQVPFSLDVVRAWQSTHCYWAFADNPVGPCLRRLKIQLVVGSYWEARVEGWVNYGGGQTRTFYVWARKYEGPTPEGSYTVVASVWVTAECGDIDPPDIDNITVTT